MVLRSKQFDDVYFSAEDGMAETHHVFLQGNDLSNRFASMKNNEEFVIAETGFGTGLNFLCAWKLFEECAPKGARMHFVSVEKYPLSMLQIREALSSWADDLGDYIDRYICMYPLRVLGPHLIRVSDRVSLSVWFGDIADILSEWKGFTVNAWFLDGFTPAKNPDMWGADLYAHMRKLSRQGTTLATFTAAGHVQRGLEDVGFHIEKATGFGKKREMVKGGLQSDGNRSSSHISYGSVKRLERQGKKEIAIIGGGLAGCTLAYLAKRSGLQPVIYEAQDSLASGASGGKLGMINPKLTAKPTPQADYYTSAYAYALRVLGDFEGVEFQQCGSLHLCVNDDKDRRFTGYVDNLGWHADHIKRRGDDLYYPDAAVVSPQKLCNALTKDIEVRLNESVESLDGFDEDVIVLANGYQIADLLKESSDLPIHPVRGQVSWVKGRDDINENICFGGYITPKTLEGFHILGSSFQPWDQNIDVTDADHEENLKRYNVHTANNSGIIRDDIIGGWTALRTSSKDRFPVVGHLKDNIYVSTAHGSHGIISSLMSAEILLARILQTPMPCSQAVLKVLSPERFRKP